MRINALSVAQALESLRSGSDGLGAREAARRLAEYGANRLERPAPQPLALRFLAEFTHLFALILWAAAALAFAAELRQPDAGMAPLGWAIVVVILVNGGFSFWQEYRAERTLAALARLLPTHVKVMRDGVTLQAEAIQLVPGDVILVQEGDEVPADCRVIESFGLRINEANVTGESLPAEKSAAPDPDAEAGRSRNVILAGTLAVAGAGRALVFATGMRTEFGRIAHLTQSAPGRLSPLQREIVRLSRLVAALATALGIGFFLVGEALGIPFWHNFEFAMWGVACELALALAIVYTPLGNRLFGTAPLAPEAWLFMLPFAAAMLLLEEARKAWLRRRLTRIKLRGGPERSLA